MGNYFSKWIIIRSDERETKKFLQIYRASNSYSKLHSSIKGMDGSITELFRDSYGEIVKFKKARVISSREKQDGENGSTIPEIDIVGLVERELKRSMSTQISKLESSLIFLATTGTTAPFIGLFGTVWGIMTSFMSLAGGEGVPSLQLVAPGIAEALIATAMGLAAAIPASIAYNYFIGKVRKINLEMEGFASEFLNIVERYLKKSWL